MEEEDNAPPAIQLKDEVFDLDFHPVHDVVAAGLVTGGVQLYKYSKDGTDLVLDFKSHASSVRSILFAPDGNALYSASSDKSLRAYGTTGQEMWTAADAHSCAVNCMYSVDQNILASGDDEGNLKIWDLRAQRVVKSYKESEDFISSITSNPANTHLVAGSGDGRLTVFDMATGTLWGKSDDMEDELLSVVVIKNGKKVVCGSQDGVLMIWSWGTWGDISDRYPGHPESIDTVLAIDEDTICTGSSDGIIRIVNIHPNKLVGLVGDHENFPVERMKWSRDKSLIGSVSHNSTISFWDVEYLKEGDLANAEGVEMDENEGTSDDDSDDSMSEEEEDKATAPKAIRGSKKSAAEQFFADL